MAVIDSIWAGNIMDCGTGTQLKIPMFWLNNPIQIQTIDGEPIAEGFISWCTKPMIISFW